MVKHLIAFGHGNGDPGTQANGMTEAEEVRRLKPYLEEWGKKSKHDFSFYEGNMFAHRNNGGTNRGGINTKTSYDSITELHLDGPQGNGGHVIIYGDYKPDNQDIRIRDLIKRHFGIVGYLQSSNGFSYRKNLYNLNRAAGLGITYRLPELFFLSNEEHYDFYIKNLDLIAKELIEAITNENLDGKATETKPAPKPKPQKQPNSNKSIAQMADEVEAGVHGQGHTNRRNSLGISQARYEEVRAEVNRRASGGASKTKTIAQMADEVEAGQHGQGHANRRRSLGISQSRYEQVRAEVNRRAGEPSTRSIDQMAHEVIAGQHGNGHDNRRRSLGVSQAVYNQVRNRVNQLA